MTDFEALLRTLTEAGVEFLVVGGVAATVHGSARLTQDLDVVYRRTPENIDRLTVALGAHEPYLRGAPPGLPFRWDSATIARGLNFTLTTDMGDLDVLGEITGGGSYDELREHSIVIRVFGLECRVLGLRRLIEVKRAAGRPKDLEAISELEKILEESARG
ncbi:MAG: nucleotidyltransferase [Vicinamibacteria bacterium]